MRQIFSKLPSRSDYSYITGTLHKYPGLNEAGLDFEVKSSEEFKYFHVVWFGPLVPIVNLFHPDSVRQVVKSSAPKPRSSYLASGYDMLTRWLGEGLLIANGAKWARSRRLLTPAFHFDILKQYVDVYNQSGDLLIEKMKKLSKTDQSFDLYPLINLDALDIILRCAFSYKSNCQTKEKSPDDYSTVIEKIQLMAGDRFLKPHYFSEFIYSFTSQGREFYRLCDVAHKVAEEVIEKRRKELETDPTLMHQGKVRDFLDTLLTARDEDGAGLSLLEIRNEVDTFLFEGHDTTASGMTWTLYSLAKHPEYQERVYQEIMDVLQGRENLEWSDLSKLEFTTMCIKESLRLNATVPVIERKLAEDCVIQGYTLPAGSRVSIQIYALHHNPHVWEEPFEYKPERFHPDNQKNMDPFQFLPFSAGSRNCIGQNFAMNEMKVTISKVIQNFQLSLDPGYEALRLPVVTMKSEKGVFVRAKARR
ncbi:calmodulin-beta [Biomphalaria glabrata]|nr:calmodulin-beta-like cytochrome P450 4F22-like P Cell adhesion/Shell formation [Biomphalaria glabrata]